MIEGSQYIKNVVRALRELKNPKTSKKLFERVGRAADIDLERIAKIPAHPSATVSSMGGELSDSNDSIFERILGVTVVVPSTSDAFMDAALESIDLICEALVKALQSSRDFGGIMCVYESEDAAVVREGQSDLIMRTLVFHYVIDRGEVPSDPV